MVGVAFGAGYAVLGQDGQSLCGDVRGELRLDDGEGGAGLVAQSADAAGAGVEGSPGVCWFG